MSVKWIYQKIKIAPWPLSARYLRNTLRFQLWCLMNLKVPSFSFMGRHVVVRSGNKLKHGKLLNIGDMVVLDCNSIHGLTIGDRVTIRDFSKIDCQSVIENPSLGLTIGNNVGISEFAFIQVRGQVTIGNDVIIGPRVTILSEEHNFADPECPVRLQGVTQKDIEIGNNVWIGASVTILGGATIGDGAIIAAGAVIRGVVEPFTIYAGVPAKFKKDRKKCTKASI